MDGYGCAGRGGRRSVSISGPRAAQLLPSGARTALSANSKSSTGSPGRACRRLAAPLPGPITWRAEARIAERSSISPFASGAPAIVAAAAAAFCQPSAGTTTAHAEPHGDLGAPDAGSETTGARIVWPHAAASDGPAAHGNYRGARSARHAAGTAGGDHRFQPPPRYV